MTGHANWFMEYVGHPIQDLFSETYHPSCCKCDCGLPATSWNFASNEKKVPRYDDDVVCFFAVLKDEQMCYSASGKLTDKEMGGGVEVKKTVSTKRVLNYLRFGGKHAKAGVDGYYCVPCFVENSDVPKDAKNEAETLCITYGIGLLRLPMRQ